MANRAGQAQNSKRQPFVMGLTKQGLGQGCRATYKPFLSAHHSGAHGLGDPFEQRIGPPKGRGVSGGADDGPAGAVDVQPSKSRLLGSELGIYWTPQPGNGLALRGGKIGEIPPVAPQFGPLSRGTLAGRHPGPGALSRRK